MDIAHLDHIVLTVKDLQHAVRFYCDLLGMQKVVFDDGRVAVRFGRQKINLHQAGHEIEPCASRPTPGSADLCFITTTALEEAMRQVRAKGIEIIAGPVPRTGASGRIDSFYFRDPDGNLIEVAVVPAP